MKKEQLFEQIKKVTLSYFENKTTLTSFVRSNFCSEFDFFMSEIKNNNWEQDFISWLSETNPPEDYFSLKYYYKYNEKILTHNIPVLLMVFNFKKQLLDLLDIGYKFKEKEYALMYFLFSSSNNMDSLLKIIPHMKNYPAEYQGELLYNYAKSYNEHNNPQTDLSALIIYELFYNSDITMTNRMLCESIEASKQHYGSPSFLFLLHNKFTNHFEKNYTDSMLEQLHVNAFTHFLCSGVKFSDEHLEIIKKELTHGFYKSYTFPSYIMPLKNNFSGYNDNINYNVGLDILEIFNAKNDKLKLGSLFSEEKPPTLSKKRL